VTSQRRQQELEQANRELQAYSWRVAHELKGPVGRLQGFAAGLRVAVDPGLHQRGSHYLGRIGALVQDMGDLVQGLLALACDAQRGLRPERVDLSLMAADTLATLLEDEPRELLEVRIQPGLFAHADPGAGAPSDVQPAGQRSQVHPRPAAGAH